MGIGFAIILGVLLVRAFSGDGTTKNDDPPTAARPTTRSGVATLLVWFTMPGIIIGTGYEILAGSYLLVPLVVAECVLTFPRPIVRRVLIPLGWPRASYTVSHLSWLRWTGDIKGGALVQAALAASRSSRPDALTWVEGKLQNISAIKASTALASAYLVTARGQHEEARGLFRAARSIDGTVTGPRASQLASEWLALDAIQREAWGEAETAFAFEANPTQRLRFLRHYARSLAGRRRAPLRATWYWLWGLLSFRTLPLLYEAWFPRPSAPRPEEASAEVVAPPHVSDHFRIVAKTSLAPLHEVVGLARAWEAYFADETRQVDHDNRAISLRARRQGWPRRAMIESIREDLKTCVGQRGAALSRYDDLPGMLYGLGRDDVRQAQRELERAVRQLDARHERKEELPPMAELRAWLGVHRRYLAVVKAGDETARFAAFDTLAGPALNYSVWLYNDRGERRLSQLISAQILIEARSVGDDARIALCEEHLECESN